MKNFILLLVLALLIFIPGNNILNLTNPDEVFYAQTAREMAQYGSWNVPYLFGQPQFEKPILTYWLLRAGYILCGETNFGARLFPSLFAIIGALAVYWFVIIAYKNERKAWLSALILMSSGLYLGIGRLVFTDTIFSVFILLALTSFFWAYQESKKKRIGILLAFMFSALAVLTKGPLGFIIPVLIIVLFLGIRREWQFIYDRAFLMGIALFLIIASPWYIYITVKYGTLFLQEFFYNDHWRRLVEAEHPSNDTWYFYPLTMFGCMFPWTIFVAGGLIYYVREKIFNRPLMPVQSFVLLWVMIVFIIFQLAHSKLVSYILPMFPALAIMAGDCLDDWLKNDTRLLRMMLLISTILLLFIPITFIFGLIKYPIYLPSKQEVVGLIVAYLVMIMLMLLKTRSSGFLGNIYLLGLQAPLMLVIIFLTRSNFEVYTTSKNATDYLLQNYKVEGPLLCTKMFLRGTRYFTDNNVAVLTMNGTTFFSQHPVTNLNTEYKTVEFLRQRPVTYGFVNKSYWQALERLAANHKLRLELLKVIGDQYVIRCGS